MHSSKLGPDLTTLNERQLKDEIHYFTERDHAGAKKQTHESTDFSWNIV